MQDLDAPLADDGAERAGIFLTNALTGWEPTEKEKQLLAFPEMAAERDRANQVKRDRPILVILGNPPYNGFAGMAVDEKRELSDAYRTPKRVRRPEGQGLNDLYVRFFRMAERRIAEKTGRGVIGFIIYLNARTFWRNVPAAVWTYKLGGYQVLKKWLSYRDSSILGRSLLPEEVQHFTDTARRIGAILAATKSSHPDRNTSYGS